MKQSKDTSLSNRNRNNILDLFFGNNFFENDAHRNSDEDSNNRGMTFTFGVPRMWNLMTPREWGVPDWGHQNMRDMMTSMHQNMAEMMKNMRNNLGQSERNGGRMVIIKSGPGYHYEKHYDIGPNGKMMEVSSEESAESGEDMRKSYK